MRDRLREGSRLVRQREMAGRRVDNAVRGGPRARRLACDEWYGRDSSFLDRVAATGLRYLFVRASAEGRARLARRLRQQHHVNPGACL